MVILGVAAWMLLGDRGANPQDQGPVTIIPPAHETPANDSVEPSGLTVDTQSAEIAVAADLVVYITGEVVNPGVYTVASGQRLADVVEMAGGPTEIADLERVNLAGHVSDARHYRIPTLGASNDAPVGFGLAATVQDETATSGTAPADACAVPVDINTATAECLETLPGIGSVRAQSILAHREQAGPFVTADGITSVSGIGDGIYGRIANMITVGGR